MARRGPARRPDAGALAAVGRRPRATGDDATGRTALAPPGRETDDLRKLATGCLVFALATAWLAAGHLVVPAGGRIPLVWALLFHMASNVGWLFFAPTAMALFARAAPPAVNAQMVGVYYLSIFGGSLLSGPIGVLYERIEPQSFWLLHAAIAGAGGLLLLLIGNRLNRALGLAPGTSSNAQEIRDPGGGTRASEST